MMAAKLTSTCKQLVFSHISRNPINTVIFVPTRRKNRNISILKNRIGVCLVGSGRIGLDQVCNDKTIYCSSIFFVWLCRVVSYRVGFGL